MGLRLPADIAAWWDRFGSEVDPGALQELADADRPLALPLAVATRACTQLVGLPGARLIDLGLASGLRGRLAGRLADPFLDTPSVGLASSLVDGLLSSRRTLRPFLRRRLLSPAGHVELTYGSRDGRLSPVRLRLLQAQHPLRRLVHYARLVIGPPPVPPAPPVGSGFREPEENATAG